MKLAAALSLLLMPNFCGPVPPDARRFPTGVYDYAATVPRPDGRDSLTLRGTLAIDRVEPDSLVGRWQVAGVAPTIAQNYFDVVGYHAVAEIAADSLSIVHSLKPRRADRAPRCIASATRPGFWGDGRCTLTLRSAGSASPSSPR